MPMDFTLHSDPVLSVAAPDRAAPLRQDSDELTRGWATARVMKVDRRNRFAIEPARGDRQRIRLEPALDLADSLPRNTASSGGPRTPGTSGRSRSTSSPPSPR